MTRLTISHKLFPACIGVLFAAFGFLEPEKASATKTIDNYLASTPSKVFFDNGVPSLTAGRETTLWVQAEDFAVPENRLLNNVQFWTVEAPKSKWNRTVKYFLFYDIDGQPDIQPFASGFGKNVLKEATNRSLFNYYDEYSYSFDLEKPINIEANTIYWLGLHLSTNFDRDEIYWETTDTGFGTNGMSAYLGDFENWSRSSAPVERAFRLATSNSDTRQVGEPSVLLGSLLVLGAVLRRKKC